MNCAALRIVYSVFCGSFCLKHVLLRRAQWYHRCFHRVKSRLSVVSFMLLAVCVVLSDRQVHVGAVVRRALRNSQPPASPAAFDTAPRSQEFSENQEIEDYFVRDLAKAPTEAPTPLGLHVEEEEVEPGCTVGKNGTLHYALRPYSILDTEEYPVTLEKDALFLRFPDDSVFKRFSFSAIQMPLETLPRTRECFRMFYKSVPHVLCGRSTDDRDAWMTSITEAVFCINSRVVHASPPKLESGEKIQLSSTSTKEKRWKELLTEIEKDDKKKEEEREEKAAGDTGDNKGMTNEIEILQVLEGKPQIFVNGEKLPLYSGTKDQDIDAVIQNQEENEEQNPGSIET